MWVLTIVAVIGSFVVWRLTRGPGYEFWYTVRGEPGHWDYCGRHDAAIDSRGAPAGAVPVVEAAVREWVAVSGVPVTLRPWPEPGSIDAANPPDLRILWYSADDPAYEDRAVNGGYARLDRDGATITGATVRLNVTIYTARPEHLRTTVLHELGHAAGLDHVDDRNQLMNGNAPRTKDYAAGDLAGFAALRAADTNCPVSTPSRPAARTPRR